MACFVFLSLFLLFEMCFLTCSFLELRNHATGTRDCQNRYFINNKDNVKPDVELILLTQDSPPSYSKSRIININRKSKMILVLISNNFNSYFYESEDYTWQINLHDGVVEAIYTNVQRDRVSFGSGWSSQLQDIYVNDDWFVDDGSFYTKNTQNIVVDVENLTKEKWYEFIYCDSCESFDVVNDGYLCDNQETLLTVGLSVGFSALFCFYCLCCCGVVCVIACCFIGSRNSKNVDAIYKSPILRRRNVEQTPLVETFDPSQHFTPPYQSITNGPPLSDDREGHVYDGHVDYQAVDSPQQNVWGTKRGALFSPPIPETPTRESPLSRNTNNNISSNESSITNSPAGIGGGGGMMISPLPNLAISQDESVNNSILNASTVEEDNMDTSETSGVITYDKIGEDSDDDDVDAGQFSPNEVPQFGF